MNQETASPESSDKKNSIGIGIWITLGIVIIVWGAYWKWVAPQVIENRFDPLNTLFSGLAFWGVIYAILLQRSELALQRRELELTRGEVRGQKEQLEAQNSTLKQQRFESTFFSLLDLFNSLVNSMAVPQPGGGETLKGRECFNCFYNEFQRDYTNIKRDHLDWDDSTLCISAYDRFADYRQTLVGHYFRTLYNIIKFIAVSDVRDKQIYINIVRAQLSIPELSLLFYNCLSRHGIEKFKPYVEQFGLLENMTLEHLKHEKHKDLYKESAFKSPL